MLIKLRHRYMKVAFLKELRFVDVKQTSVDRSLPSPRCTPILYGVKGGVAIAKPR